MRLDTTVDTSDTLALGSGMGAVKKRIHTHASLSSKKTQMLRCTSSFPSVEHRLDHDSG